MSEIKKIAQGIDPNIKAHNVVDLAAKCSKNIYEALTVISKRSNQISVDLKRELHSKLEEFASTTDNLEEIHENKEQIEISKFYERLPNPVLIAVHEFENDNIYYRLADNTASTESGEA